MKKLFLGVLTLLVLAGVAVLAVSPILVADDSPDAPPSNSTTTIFKVEGMTCGGCEVGVRLAVKKLAGVETVTASYDEGRAEVAYDPEEVTPEEIEAAIESLGYEAEPEQPEGETGESASGSTERRTTD